jgi:hypothetical protein
MKLSLWLILVIASSGFFLGAKCEQKPDPLAVGVTADMPTELQRNEAVSIKLIAKFKDYHAYNNIRKVYLVEYEGQKFLGITGVGISEVGTHSVYNAATKTSNTVTDER